MSWREKLPTLVREARFRTQSELVSALTAAGTQVDQAAISRELKALGAIKIDGIYRLPAAHDIELLSAAITAQGCLVVIHTTPVWAPVLASRIDEAALDGVLGTIAGDDTVFVATTGATASDALLSWIDASEA